MKISDYDIVRQIGQGYSSTVYLIKKKRDPQSNLALKKISKKGYYLKDSSFEMIKREISVLKTLQGQEHALQLIESSEDNQYFYIFTEFCSGGTLLNYAKSLQPVQQKNSKALISLMKQLILGYEELYNLHILHRDIKLENIYLDEEKGTWKYGDFGFSKVGRTSETILGTDVYMSPEIINGQCYDYKTDIWSLGIVFYCLLYKQFPFSISSPKSRLEQIRRCRLGNTLDIINPRLKTFTHPLVYDLLNRMLSYNPETRITMQELLNHPLFQFLKESTQIEAPQSNHPLICTGTLPEQPTIQEVNEKLIQQDDPEDCTEIENEGEVNTLYTSLQIDNSVKLIQKIHLNLAFNDRQITLQAHNCQFVKIQVKAVDDLDVSNAEEGFADSLPSSLTV